MSWLLLYKMSRFARSTRSSDASILQTINISVILAMKAIFLLSVIASVTAFAPVSVGRSATNLSMVTGEKFDIFVDMPPTTSELKAKLVFESLVEGPSEIVEVRYKLPFGLDVAPKNNLAVCTKDGQGGEKVGDILRYSSRWSMGLPRGDGVLTTAASFSGAIGWQCSLLDVARASSWDEVVEALISNKESQTDEVVLVFERPLSE